MGWRTIYLDRGGKLLSDEEADAFEQRLTAWHGRLLSDPYLPHFHFFVPQTRNFDRIKVYTKALAIKEEWYSVSRGEIRGRPGMKPRVPIDKFWALLHEDTGFLNAALVHEIAVFLLESYLDALDFEMPGEFSNAKDREIKSDPELVFKAEEYRRHLRLARHSGHLSKATFEQAMKELESSLPSKEEWEEIRQDAEAGEYIYNPVINTPKRRSLRQISEEPGGREAFLKFISRVAILLQRSLPKILTTDDVTNFTIAPLAQVFLQNLSGDSLRRYVPPAVRVDIGRDFDSDYRKVIQRMRLGNVADTADQTLLELEKNLRGIDVT